MRRHNGGFTLTELLIVVVVLGIIALVVAPSASSADENRLMAAGRLSVADLSHARLRSLGSAADRCVVVFEPGGGGYHLALQSDPAQPLVDPLSGRPYLRRFIEDASLRGVTLGTVDVGTDLQLVYTGLGTIDQAGDAGITFECGGRTLTVVVDAATGRARLVP